MSCVNCFALLNTGCKVLHVFDVASVYHYDVFTTWNSLYQISAMATYQFWIWIFYADSLSSMLKVAINFLLFFNFQSFYRQAAFIYLALVHAYLYKQLNYHLIGMDAIASFRSIHMILIGKSFICISDIIKCSDNIFICSA